MLDIYQIDAFADKPFEGNPAAVVPLTHWPEDSLLQSIAAENNLAETSFMLNRLDHWELRWFTPEAEVALCGHATLAAAYVVFSYLDTSAQSVSFKTRQSGTLEVSRLDDEQLSMSFPAIAVEAVDISDTLKAALGCSPVSAWKGHYTEDQFDLMAVFDEADKVISIQPHFSNFSELNSRGVIVTAAGKSCDFISRYFAPEFGIPEDPVTGSAHCLSAPYWASELNKSVLSAVQMSKRTGKVECRVSTDRVELVGSAVEYLKGSIAVDIA